MASQGSEHALKALAEAWQRERATARQSVRQQRKSLTLAERVERGYALRDLIVDDVEPSAGGRALLWVKPRMLPRFEDVRLSPGEPVRLWSRSPDGPDVELGVLARVQPARLAIAVAADYSAFLDLGAFALDRDAPEVSFERGTRALGQLISAKPSRRAVRWRALLFGGAEPDAARAAPPMADTQWFDSGLNPSQRAAVSFALSAPELALIHGPPGTGKTRTLVELVRQALRRGERVLVTAASNAAVDNLAERLVAHGVPLLRLGHPARVAASVIDSSLDARLERSEARRLARRWMAQAVELRRRIDKRRARGQLDARQARAQLDEAKRGVREAYAQLDLARQLIFAEAKVVCTTAAGADPAALAAFEFDRVVLDEATQAVDPLALVALLQADRAVLAGDPCQLAPTVVDVAAARAGLSSTFFERLAESHGDRLVRLLDVQYRMHEALMQFPSHSMYGGRLRSGPHVRTHTLELLGIKSDAYRPGPLVFLDTAGMGFGEVCSGDDKSTSNPGQAERVAVEVQRLLRRGLDPSQLGVIAPYDAQVRVLRVLLAAAVERGLEISSIDGFQGREKEAIVLDLVRSNDEGEIGFLRDTRRMNVALTRARRFLLVVGDGATLAADAYYRAFMDSAQAQGAARSAWDDDGTWVESD